MELHNLKPAPGSTKKAKRIGRGQGSGYGGTSTKGHNGAQSRSGYSKKIGHEGGQQPLQRRVPKYGFKNPFRVEYQAINLGKLEELAKEKKIKAFDHKVFMELGLAGKNDLVKILADGEFSQKMEITANAFSKKAVEIIEKTGGKAISLKGKKTDATAAKEAPASKAAPVAKEVPAETKEKPAAKAKKESSETVKEEPKTKAVEAKEEKKEKATKKSKPESSEKKDEETE